MKLSQSIPVLLLLAIGLFGTLRADQPTVCTFNSPLVFKGSQWRVKSAVGPVYLARWERSAWRVLAVFDGTKGQYHLDWENPASGLYSAVDSAGACSESVKISDERPQADRDLVAAAARGENKLGLNPRDLSEFHRLMLVSMVETPSARK